MARKTTDSSNLSLFPPAPVPQMPEGYYSGDKPNPNLRRFAEEQGTPYHELSDTYDVPPFREPLEMTKNTAIYNMHSYHQGKKPYDAICKYILHYTRPGDLVLDPFCGSGSTGLAALLNGRKAVLVDISPAATFITRNYVSPVPLEALDAALDGLLNRLFSDEQEYYGVKCPRCGGSARIGAIVFSTIYECPRCLSPVSLLEAQRAAHDRRNVPMILRQLAVEFSVRSWCHDGRQLGGLGV